MGTNDGQAGNCNGLAAVLLLHLLALLFATVVIVFVNVGVVCTSQRHVGHLVGG